MAKSYDPCEAAAQAQHTRLRTCEKYHTSILTSKWPEQLTRLALKSLRKMAPSKIKNPLQHEKIVMVNRSKGDVPMCLHVNPQR